MAYWSILTYACINAFEFEEYAFQGNSPEGGERAAVANAS